MSDLEGHLTRNVAMWEVWVREGVTPDTLLAVEFHFYAANREAGEILARAIRKAGLEVQTRLTRYRLIYKGMEITATETTRWDLARLQARTLSLFNAAAQVGVTLEGCGAEMPGTPEP